MSKNVTPDNEAPSNITDHAYVSPAGKPWGKCAFPGCGLGESVHQESDTPYPVAPLPYRCPNCVTKEIDPCPHTKENWESPDALAG